MFAIMYIAFGQSLAANVMASLCIGFTAIYLAVPVISLRFKKRLGGVGMSGDLQRGPESRTGDGSERESVIQIVRISACILTAATCVGIIWTIVR